MLTHYANTHNMYFLIILKRVIFKRLLCSRQGIYMNRLGGLILETYLNFLLFKCFYYTLDYFYFLKYLNFDLTWVLLVECIWRRHCAPRPGGMMTQALVHSNVQCQFYKKNLLIVLPTCLHWIGQFWDHGINSIKLFGI